MYRHVLLMMPAEPCVRGCRTTYISKEAMLMAATVTKAAYGCPAMKVRTSFIVIKQPECLHDFFSGVALPHLGCHHLQELLKVYGAAAAHNTSATRHREFRGSAEMP
jgi:hypothetical protein